jgi:hypothetical protein
MGQQGKGGTLRYRLWGLVYRAILFLKALGGRKVSLVLLWVIFESILTKSFLKLFKLILVLLMKII